ncbi:MAG TPA: hypothetical protein VFM45_13465, partial [Anaeromyxobacteraceae bacterium]|nr:hypothetical protein [Anaeromyxobacteraceae bacterium]
MIPIAVLLAVGLAAPPAPAAAQASPAPEISEPRDWNQPPPGSPDDVALWTRLRDVQNASVVHMARVAQAAFRIRYGRYYESLDERAGSGSADGRDAARRMRARVEKAAADADAAIP